MEHSPFVISGPAFCLESSETLPGSYGMFCLNGKIQKIAPLSELKSTLSLNVEYLEFSPESHVLPGMIDLHIHGAAGFDVMDATPEALEGISQALLQDGTTGFFATTMTDTSKKIERALRNIAEQTQGRLGEHLLGIHLEGPFLAKSRMGAQCEAHIIPPDPALFDEWVEVAPGKIKLVTLAVETPGALDFIRHLVSKKIVASIGHTDATYREALASFDAGVSYSTHLFNAMRGIHHREPGCACAVLLDDRVTAELIVDGVHLHPDMVNFALKLKKLDRTVLVTDAMRARCLGDGVFELGRQSVTVKGNEARLPGGTLAGSVLSMKEAFLNVLSFAGLSYREASRLVSVNPAKVAGCFHERGSLEAGKRADFWIMNKNHEIEATFFSGCRVQG